MGSAIRHNDQSARVNPSFEVSSGTYTTCFGDIGAEHMPRYTVNDLRRPPIDMSFKQSFHTCSLGRGTDQVRFK